jgi:proteasome accessory factor B
MLFIHEELKRGAFVNCTKLATRLEVSAKTIMRDLAFMRDRLDLPLEYDPKLYAYRYTYPVENFPTVQVTEGEMVALLVAQKALEQYKGTPYQQQLSIAFEKLSSGLRDRISFTPDRSAMGVSFHNLGLGKTDLKVFELLSRAVLNELELEFDYQKPQSPAPVRRRIRPYHLANRENLWYLVGYDLERQAIRSFALPRVTNPAVTKKKFARPADFSPDRYFGKTLGAFVGNGDYAIRIRFDAETAVRVRERFWHESQEATELPDGRLELTLHLGDLEEVTPWIMSWSSHAEVLEPEELRKNVRAAALRLARLHR